MKTALLILGLSSLAMVTNDAQACGPRCGGRRVNPRAAIAYSPTFISPTYHYQPPIMLQASTATSPPIDAPNLQALPQVGGEATRATAQPRYVYEATPEQGVPYYYTYDESGKLVVSQWMDWLFRGGRRAGLPAPPLPIVGRLGN